MSYPDVSCHIPDSSWYASRAGAAEPEPETWHSQEHQDSRFVGSADASVLHCLEKLLKSMKIYEIL